MVYNTKLPILFFMMGRRAYKELVDNIAVGELRIITNHHIPTNTCRYLMYYVYIFIKAPDYAPRAHAFCYVLVAVLRWKIP